jgi:hypothetical protein
MTQTLSVRALNRATLARQYLLDRVAAHPIDVIEHLAGMQSQAPLAPYIGLWTRVRDFEPDELSASTEKRQVVRTQLMRNTVHLVSARDCLEWHGLFDSLRTAGFGAHFGALDGVDRQALLHEARQLLEAGPRTRAELGALLARRWPHVEPAVLAYAATLHIAVCQAPPRGIWGAGGAAAWTPVEDWLGEPLRTGSVGTLVVRYLSAFGPATIADVQLWSGLRKLAEVVAELPLRTFRGEAGQTLYDLPSAPRPAEDSPAPPRFLPAYDNLLLSYRDRTRVIPDKRPVPLPPGNGATTGTFLLDGLWRGVWHSGHQSFQIRPFETLHSTERDALLAEAIRLDGFITPQGNRDVVIIDPS